MDYAADAVDREALQLLQDDPVTFFDSPKRIPFTPAEWRHQLHEDIDSGR